LALRGVKNINVCLDTQSAAVEYDFRELSMSEIVRAVCNLGFSAKPAISSVAVGIQDATLLIGGMMCRDCVRKVNEKLRAINGVHKVEVSLEDNQASVSYEVTLTSIEQILEAVGELGFVVNLPDNIPPSKVIFHLDHLSCELCATSIERVLVDKPGVNHVEVSLSERSCSVSFFDYQLKPSSIQEYIEATGYNCHMKTLETPPQLDSALYRYWLASIVKYDYVVGVTCQSHVRHIEEELSRQRGVMGIKVSLELSTAAVVFLLQKTDPEEIRQAIANMGYECSIIAGLAEKDDEISTETEVLPPINEKSPLLSPMDDRAQLHASQRSLQMVFQKSIERLSNLSRASSQNTFINMNTAVLQKAFFIIRGMTCLSCVATIEKNLQKVEGVHHVLVALLAERAEVRFDPKLITSEQIAEAIDDMGFDAAVLEDAECIQGELVLFISGMTCVSCINSIEKTVLRIPGVLSASVSLSNHKGTFTFDPDIVGPRAIVEAIETCGFNTSLPSSAEVRTAARLSHREEIRKWRAAFLISLLFGVPTMALMIFYMTATPSTEDRHNQTMVIPGLSLENALLFALATPVQFIGGRHFYRAAARSLRHGSANMDVLIMLATNISYFYSVIVLIVAMAMNQAMSPMTFFDTVPMLIVFLCLGRWMESVAKGATTEALTKLIEMEPTTALIVDPDDQESDKEIEAQLVSRGDILKVLPGTRVPVDGRVLEGQSQVDEAHITGESLPVDKGPEDIVYSGSINLNGVLIIRATHVGQETTIGQIVKL
ncbi:copper-transporting ATPase 1-like, partial [Tropilaelaps mercedesae]